MNPWFVLHASILYRYALELFSIALSGLPTTFIEPDGERKGVRPFMVTQY